jgi:hypothetical protein
VNNDLVSVFLDEFGKIARTRNLRNLAGLMGNGDGTVRLELEVEKLVDRRRLQFSPLLSETPEVRDGDILRVKITNPTKSFVDVTVLYVQSDQQIDCFFPRGMDFNRLGPGESHFISGIKINVDTVGLEDLMVIGVAATGSGVPASFAFLRQPSLEQAQQERASRGGADPSWNSPLGLLTRGRMFDPSLTSRGASTETLESFTIRRLSWNVVKE